MKSTSSTTKCCVDIFQNPQATHKLQIVPRRNPWWDLRGHPDERPSWGKITLMRDHPEERQLWGEKTLMRDDVGQTTLKKDHPEENDPDKRWHWWTTIMRRNDLDDRWPSAWRKTNVRRNNPDIDKRPPWTKTTLPETFPSVFNNNTDARNALIPIWRKQIKVHFKYPSFKAKYKQQTQTCQATRRQNVKNGKQWCIYYLKLKVRIKLVANFMTND